MIGLEIDIDLKQLRRNLESLEPKVARKIEKQAMRPAMRIIQREAKANAPRDTGAMSKAIKLRAMKRSRSRRGIEVRIDKEGNYRGDHFYGAFQEFGWKAGSRKLGDGRREIPGQHFMQRAFETKGPEAEAMAIRGIWQGIEAAASGR